jgi:hypothetical protein
VNRPGAILLPIFAGFLLTVAVVSWRSGWWPSRETLESFAAAPPRIELRRSNLRIVPVHLTASQPATVAAAPAAPPPAAPMNEPAPVSEPGSPPPVPRANAGNSPDREIPVRKFARGGSADSE